MLEKYRGGAPECACRPSDDALPEPFLRATFVKISESDLVGIDPDDGPGALALTADYELGKWRAQALAAHLLDWAADFALRRSERENLTVGRLQKVARQVVQQTFGNSTDKGAPGEVLLHAVCRELYRGDVVINKVFFKTAENDTVKGFDGVHMVHSRDGLELWLGESKFYKSISDAVRDVVAELGDHFEAGYLRKEFALVLNKLEDDHPHADDIRHMMSANTSLDEIFKRVVVPVLLTYNSRATSAHAALDAAYQAALDDEVSRIWANFIEKLGTAIPVDVQLILVPLATKADLLAALATERSY